MQDEKMLALCDAFAGASQILILTHNDPDPDAIGSAVALRHLLTHHFPVPITIGYRGIIGRAENRALVRYLGSPLQQFSRTDLDSSAFIAMVDTQPGVGNSPLRRPVEIAAVFDHHPWHAATASARFADVRPEYGSTSTMLTEYLRLGQFEFPADIATALFYGLKSDTMGLGRSASKADIDAYSFLVPLIDSQALFEIERAQVSTDYFKSLVNTLRATNIYRDVLIATLGPMNYPDLAAEVADWLLRLKGIQWVICLGNHKDHVYLAVRSRRQRGGAGQLAQAAVGSIGTAGGHGNMAGGQVRLNGRDPEVVANQIIKAVLDYFNIDPEETRRSLL